jgi:hypothetical protein
MLDFERSQGWRALEERAAATQSPRQRRILQTVIAHSKAVAAFDLDGLMATLVPEPMYHFWSSYSGKDHGPKGYAAVRQYYKDYVASGAAYICSPKERIIVDDHNVCTESTLTTLASGRIAKARGYRVDDESAHYLVRMRNTVLWSFDENGLAYGEDAYSVWDPNDFEKVATSDLPKPYLDYLASIGHRP